MKKLLVTIALILIIGTNLFSQKPEYGLDDMIIISYNIRYDNPGDGVNRWDNRREKVASLLNFYHPDIFGLQEALLHQNQYLVSVMSDYTWVGVGRDDGKENGEYSPVFYDTDKLEILNWGTFWLSGSPDTPSTGWDAALPRICTWIKFNQKSSGKEFFFFNTHFDHQGEKARYESSRLISLKIKELAKDMPVMLSGDFNQNPSSPGYSEITQSLIDAKVISDKEPYGPEGTYSGFESGKELGNNRIDYIFINKKFHCKKFRTITDHNGQYYPSDHLPVMAIVSGK